LIHRPFVLPLADDDDGSGESTLDPLPGVDDPLPGVVPDKRNDVLDGGVVILNTRNLVSYIRKYQHKNLYLVTMRPVASNCKLAPAVLAVDEGRAQKCLRPTSRNTRESATADNLELPYFVVVRGLPDR